MVPEVARRQPPDVRRQQILDGAERVLVRQGLDATTMADVSEEAGVAKGTVYLYFASKGELLAALRSRYLARMTEVMDPGQGGTAARLDRFIDELFDFSLTHHQLHHVLFHQAGFHETDAFLGARRALEAVIGDGVASGEITLHDPEPATVFLLHGLHGVLVHGLHAPSSDQRRFAAAAKDLVRRVLAIS